MNREELNVCRCSTRAYPHVFEAHEALGRQCLLDISEENGRREPCPCKKFDSLGIFDISESEKWGDCFAKLSDPA